MERPRRFHRRFRHGPLTPEWVYAVNAAVGILSRLRMLKATLAASSPFI
jgi:hypothetical protein